MFHPETSRFRVSLESVLDRKDERSIKLIAKAMFVPLGICVIDCDEGRSFRRRRVCECILCVSTVDTMAEFGRQCEE